MEKEKPAAELQMLAPANRGDMTPEQDQAIKAFLKAVATAKQTGLTATQIVERMEATEQDELPGEKALEGIREDLPDGADDFSALDMLSGKQPAPKGK